MDIFLTELQIFEITGFSKTKLFEMIEAGEFPKPVDNLRSKRWLESEVLHWLSTRDLHISR
jgi:predicted DNA-binding transcriptional regulator AlpA